MLGTVLAGSGVRAARLYPLSIPKAVWRGQFLAKGFAGREIGKSTLGPPMRDEINKPETS